MSEQGFQISEQEFQEFQALVQRLEEVGTDDFFELAKLLGRDPKRDFVAADLSRTDLTGGDLSNADLRHTDLSHANLSRANLSRANLSRANLRGVNLSDADLGYADLSDADLSDANLSNTNVKNAQFGDGLGLSKDMRFDLKQRGANLKDSSVESYFSAILLTPDRYLWLGSNKTSTIERLSFLNSQKFAEHKQFKVANFIELPIPEEQEIDIEGIAYSDYYLWFVGSHSWKRKKPKENKTDVENIERLTKLESEANRYILGRIPLIDGELLRSCPHPENPNEQLSSAKLYLTNRGNLLMDALASDPHLGAFVEATIPGKENGFDIEGLAIYQNRIFLGLRGPVLRGWAVMLEIELEDIGLGRLLLKKVGQKKQYKKHFIYLNGLGIRDLCWDGEDLLILAGPTMDLDGPVRVYRLKDGVNLQENVLSKPDIVMEIPYGNGEEHAEGMTLFNDINQIPSLLVVYDSPAKRRLEEDGEVIVDVFNLSGQKTQSFQRVRPLLELSEIQT